MLEGKVKYSVAKVRASVNETSIDRMYVVFKVTVSYYLKSHTNENTI